MQWSTCNASNNCKQLGANFLLTIETKESVNFYQAGTTSGGGTANRFRLRKVTMLANGVIQAFCRPNDTKHVE